MKGCFVSGLWGDSCTQARPSVRDKHSLRDEIRQTVEWPYQTEPRLVYCFGEENFATLDQLGLYPVMLSPDAVVNYTGQTERNPQGQRGWVNYGADISRQKFVCIAAALKTFEAVTWLDWDVRLVKPLPPDYWDRMNAGAAIQASLGNGYKRKQCSWRRVAPKLLHHTWFLYVRGLAVAERLLVVAALHPEVYDERIAAMVIDELLGKWQGPEHYKLQGGEPYCATGPAYPIFQVFPVIEEVFHCYGK